MAWKAGSPKHIEESLAIRSTLCLSATAIFTGRFLRWIFFIRPGSHRPLRADLISSFRKCPGIYGIFCATRTRKPSYWKPTVCFQEPIQDSKKEFLRWKQKLPRWMWLARRRRRQQMLMWLTRRRRRQQMPRSKTFLTNAKLCFKKATAHSWQLSTINFLW